MAQTNYTPIILYNSGTTGNTPSTSNLAGGELAINYTDGKLFYKDNSSTLQVIGWKTTPTTAGGTGLTSYTAGDLPYYSSGSALSKLSIGTSGYILESNGSAPTWVAQSTLSVGTATNATNTSITDNTSSSATWYPTIVSATTGNLPQTTSSTKLSFVPSTGTLTATSHAGAWAGSTIGTTYGGTGLTSFTANGVVYASSTSALATSSAFTFNGTDVGFTGNLIPGTASKGINFTANTPASGMTSQLLNWYEEGTWTPADNSGAGLSLTITYATYTRVGRQVTINAFLTYPSTVSVANAALTGLPFNCAANNYPPLTIDSNSGVALSSFVNAVSKNISIGIASNYATTVTNSSLSSKGIIISGTYFV